MPWATTTASAVSWGGSSPATQTYTAPTAGMSVWAIPRGLPETGANAPALDFELQFRDTGHGVFSDDRPLLFLSSLSEGNP